MPISPLFRETGGNRWEFHPISKKKGEIGDNPRRFSPIFARSVGILADLADFRRDRWEFYPFSLRTPIFGEVGAKWREFAPTSPKNGEIGEIGENSRRFPTISREIGEIGEYGEIGKISKSTVYMNHIV